MTAPRPRPGGRSARVRRAVLDATLGLVLDHGIGALTVAAVANRAGVAETTVYRRWPSTTDLVADAVADVAERDNPLPDTGTFAGDLDQLARQIAALLSRPGMGRLLGATAAMSSDPNMAAAREKYWRMRFAASAPVVDRAIARGEIPAGTASYDVLEALAAPLYLRVLVTDQPLDEAFVRRCVAHTLTVFRPPQH
ncbi:TetR/AcrR family transcriptional regulator [Gordonia crocea]|uniref:Putative transcriptional regulator, TetR family protein n=1 Tax=Gordonia crocea TaxID=589162 RepID=A0A7I9UXA1_9ACTN|nr:TetR/AcrR family transcriptional regulator [Gordonia crocea]GED97705.1 putative transcriptional regulator, TetR family protein [Gordonia crocea]